MKTNIGLSDEACAEVGQILNLLIADEYVLYATTRDFQWNVTGPRFSHLQEQFGGQHAAIALSIDSLAERARALGRPAQGNLAALVRSARTSSDPGAGLPSQTMVTGLLLLHEEIVIQLRVDRTASLRIYQDTGTANLLTSLMNLHEKAAESLRGYFGEAFHQSAHGC